MPNPRLVPGLFLALALAAAVPAPAQSRQPAARPNVVFILADDMGYGDLGCYGNAAVPTPHLDRLAAEGIRFEHFYVVAPICSPSRAGFTTGQYPQRWDITSFLASRRANQARGLSQFLDPSAPTLARALHAAGYATGHFGKWHLGGQRDVGEAPLITAYGFDDSLTQFEGLGDRVLPVFSRPMNPGWKDNRHPLSIASASLGRGRVEFVPRADVTNRFVDAALAFIRESRAAAKPFYLNLWPDDPHSPVEPSAPWRGDNSVRPRYLGVIRELDRDVGRLIAFIRSDPALRDNTLILFSSDNGPEEGYGSTAGLRGHKTTLYEGGIREPFIVWGPGLVARAAAGTTNRDTVVSALDLLPSLLAIAGVPALADATPDGLDLSAALLGRAALARSRPLFWSRPPDRPGPNKELPDLAVREGRWKLLADHDGSAPQLYDLETDPGETINFAAQQPDRVAALWRQIVAWQAGVK